MSAGRLQVAKSTCRKSATLGVAGDQTARLMARNLRAKRTTGISKITP